MQRILNNKGTRTGLFFGATSGVITTIGLIAGLHAGTNSLVPVLGGILVVAVADAMSDAMGIHLAQESDPDADASHVWTATLWTFFTNLVVALSFSLPLFWFPLQAAVAIAVGWGFLIITLLSIYIARIQRAPALHVVTEHLVIAIVVVGVSHYIGIWVGGTFN